MLTTGGCLGNGTLNTGGDPGVLWVTAGAERPTASLCLLTCRSGGGLVGRCRAGSVGGSGVYSRERFFEIGRGL